ncbi:SprT-like domain-containing protein [Cobetia amphilecti]|uniref:SprT family zinc-dependent metalloprotease n=1 Tax=Cobetia amphilecti TaxID=1055104 RepID=UPI00254FF409|nr:SprT-like domain-containing protein [Cobetia amphilecti]
MSSSTRRVVSRHRFAPDHALACLGETPATPLPLADAAALETLTAPALHATLEAQVLACLARARALFPELRMPSVSCRLKGRTAGTADSARQRLRFNWQLLSENRHHFLSQTVPHEVAHWVVMEVVERAGKTRVKPHGPEWQQVMTNLYGIPPEVTHRMDVSTASPTPWAYGCGCDTAHYFSSRRHANAQRGHRYRCRRCGQELSGPLNDPARNASTAR